MSSWFLSSIFTFWIWLRRPHTGHDVRRWTWRSQLWVLISAKLLLPHPALWRVFSSEEKCLQGCLKNKTTKVSFSYRKNKIHPQRHVINRVRIGVLFDCGAHKEWGNPLVRVFFNPLFHRVRQLFLSPRGCPSPSPVSQIPCSGSTRSGAAGARRSLIDPGGYLPSPRPSLGCDADKTL